MFIHENDKFLLLKEVQFILEKVEEKIIEDAQNSKRWESKKKIIVFVINRYLKDYTNDYLDLTPNQKNEIIEESEYLKLKPITHSESNANISLDRVKERLEKIKTRKKEN